MLPGEFLSRLEQGAEIPVKEFHAVARPHGLGGGPDGLVVLIGGDEQGGGEAVKAMLGGIAGGLLHPHLIAVGAPPVDVVRHMSDEAAQVIGPADDQFHSDLLGIFLQGVLPSLVLGIGVDIGVEPESGQLNPLLAQDLDRLIGAGGAADVHQGLHGSSFPSISRMSVSRPRRRA